MALPLRIVLSAAVSAVSYPTHRTRLDLLSEVSLSFGNTSVHLKHHEAVSKQHSNEGVAKKSPGQVRHAVSIGG